MPRCFERYGFFKHLGFFGIEPQTQRGARTFLRTTHALLASSRNAVWLTPQGRFMDVRERPLRLEEGLGALAVREPGAAFLPLAIEYCILDRAAAGNSRLFRRANRPGSEPARLAADWTRVFTGALETVQDELATRSCDRDVTQWVTLDRGKSGVSGIYDGWRWLRAHSAVKNLSRNITGRSSS